eukprot:4552056-Amphidinium_carterae.1
MPPLPVPSTSWNPPNQISSIELLEMMGMPQPDASVVVTSPRSSERSRSRTSHGSRTVPTEGQLPPIIHTSPPEEVQTQPEADPSRTGSLYPRPG